MNLSNIADSIYDAIPERRAVFKTVGCVGGNTLKVAGTLAGSTLAVIGAISAVEAAYNQTVRSARTVDTIILGGAGDRLISRIF